MGQLEVYFPNHKRALTFPWSIYHRPLLDNLLSELKKLRAGQHVLVIGPGAFQEFELLKKRELKVSILDIDPRVLELHKETYGSLIQGYYLVDEKFTGYPDVSEFDFIYAKEVIEHLPDYPLFLQKLFQCLAPSGRLWLSTPNYGFFLLPFLERTILEIIARLSGFSRKDIHPSRFDRKKLVDAIQEEKFLSVTVEEMPFKLSLVATAQKGPSALV